MPIIPEPDEKELLYEEYKKNAELINNYNSNKNIETLPNSVKELNGIVTREYILLIIWFIITLFVLLVTMITIINETSINYYAIFIIILFLFYIFYYFLNKNNYNNIIL